MAQTKLELEAIKQREKEIVRNVYKGETKYTEYGALHTRALSDAKTPLHGKGIEGSIIDEKAADMINGGDSIDISTRQKLQGKNIFKNTTTPWNYLSKYTKEVTVDTSLNKNQVKINENKFLI